MTLTVCVSVPQSQSFSCDVLTVDQYGENPPVVAAKNHLEPGQCVQVYLTSSRKLEIVELPLNSGG